MIQDGTNIKPSLESSNTSHRLIASDSNATLSHLDKDHAHITPETNASVMFQKGSSQVHTVSSQQFGKIVSRPQSVSQEASGSVSASKTLVDPSAAKTLHGSFTSGSVHHGNFTSGNQLPNNGWLQRIPESQSALDVRARGHPSTLAQPALEMHSRNGGAQRGPRIANVVHRFKCSVEPLEIGVVLSGRMWSSSQAIFPKGLFFFVANC
jgi:histone demethylase JARID1